MDVSHIICPSCSVGCGVDLVVKKNNAVGIYPYKSHPINEGKNCTKGRSCFEIVNNENRLTNSLINDEGSSGSSSESSIDQILDVASEKIKSFDPEDIAFIVSAKSSNETIYNIKKLADGLGVSNIGFFADNFKKKDFQQANYEDLDNADFIFIIGDVLLDNPLIGRRVYIAKDKGVEIASVDEIDGSFTSINSNNFKKAENLSSFLDNIPSEITDKLTSSSVILFNKLTSSDDFDKIIEIAGKNDSKILPVMENSNSVGALESLPALNKQEIMEMVAKSKLLYIVGEDEFFFEIPSINSREYTIVQSFNSNTITESSNIVFATTCWAEEDGSFTNSENTTQFFSKAVEPGTHVMSNVELIKNLAEKLSIEL